MKNLKREIYSLPDYELEVTIETYYSNCIVIYSKV